MRWPPDFPLLFCHAPWSSDDAEIRALRDHPLYLAAKRRRSVQAALQICDELYDEATMEKIQDACHAEQNIPVPLVVAPALTIGETQNALAIGYA